MSYNYLDDILVFSAIIEQHDNDIEKVMKLLKSNELYINEKKSKFYLFEAHYIGYIISDENILLEPANVAEILIWEIPKISF